MARLSVFLGAAFVLMMASSTWAEARGPVPFPLFHAAAAMSLPPPGAVTPPYTAAGRTGSSRGLTPSACYAGPVSCDLKSTHMSGHPCTCVGEWGVYWGQSG